MIVCGILGNARRIEQGIGMVMYNTRRNECEIR